MKLNMQFDGQTQYVGIDGELDHHNVTSIRNSVDDAIYVNRPKSLCIDFKKVSFMDSSGVGFIMGRYKKLSQTGGSVNLMGVSEKTAEIFKMSGISKYVNMNDEEKKNEE